MLSIALFAMIGVYIKAATPYWVVFGCYCAVKGIDYVLKIIEKAVDKDG